MIGARLSLVFRFATIKFAIILDEINTNSQSLACKKLKSLLKAKYFKFAFLTSLLKNEIYQEE